jgi:hypothetical protein
MWAAGYMTGINLQRKNWKAFFDEPMRCVNSAALSDSVTGHNGLPRLSSVIKSMDARYCD